MKKLVIPISVITLLFVFCLSSSAFEFSPVPNGIYEYNILQQMPDNSYNNPFVKEALGLDPLIFNATIFVPYGSDTQNYALVNIGINDTQITRDAILQSLSNWYELSPSVDFSDFNDINLGYSNTALTSYLNANNPYNNRDDLIYFFNQIGLYYQLNRSSNSQITSLNSQIQTLNNTINDLNTQIQTLNNTIVSKDAEIQFLNEKVELEKSKAYTQGLDDAEVVQNSFISIATMPFYFLKGIFDFELFGVNFFTVIKVILTFLFVAFVIKIFI